MEAATRTLQITLPLSDASFLRRQSRNMGWLVTTVRSIRKQRPAKFDITKTAAFKEAVADVEAGRVTKYDSVKDLFDELGIEV